jgi:hypothetical protein
MDIEKLKLSDTLIDPESGLNEREQYFLDVLFDLADGDFEYAMSLAGFPKNYPVSKLRRKLSKEIKQATKEYIVSQTPKAARGLMKVLTSPGTIGNKDILQAAKEILDRGDVNKSEDVIEIPDNVIILLPPKRSEILELDKDEYERINSGRTSEED